MFRTILTAASAGAALIIATPLLAQAHGGPNAGGNSAMHSEGPINASPSGLMNARSSVLSNAPSTSAQTDYSAKSQAQARSQGPAHASANGISHANRNSVLARGSVSGSSLSGLTTGLTVNNASGTSIGTVSRVVTGTDGSVRMVIVTSPTGQTYRLAPSSLSISGNVVTTTSTSIGG